MADDLSQSKRIASFSTPLGKDFFGLTKFYAQENLSELFEYQVEAVSNTENADLQSILDQKCSVTIKLRDGGERIFNGVLADAQWIGNADDLHLYRFTLRPWLWKLSQKADCRIFKQMKVTAILQKILGNVGKIETLVSENWDPIEYCVQYRETDLQFVSRLMEQHGIYYYFKHTADDHTLVMTDSRTGHSNVNSSAEPSFGANGGDYPFLPRGTRAGRRIEHVTQWSTARHIRTGKFILKDYDYVHSRGGLKAEQEAGFSGARKYEIFDYPRTFVSRFDEQHDFNAVLSDHDKLARIMAEARQAPDDRRYATGEAPSLYPGALMKLAMHPTSSENQQYLVVQATHSFGVQNYRSSGTDDAVYHGSYEFQKADRVFRAPLATPLPKIYGPHTAKVVAENNDDSQEGGIDVDKFGRVFLRFHWDREDKSTSCRVRVAQLWAGKNWGGQFIPRIGQEVVVEFLEGNPDLPLVVGAVYNDAHMPPYTLPANKTQSGVKSESTDSKGSPGHYNEIKFEDKKGSELFSTQAEKDQYELVKNDLHTVIGNTEKREIAKEYKGSGYSRETTVHNGDMKLDIKKGKLDVEAKTEINLKVGESTIKMLPTSIEISSPTITIKSVAKTEVLSDAMVIINGAMVKIN